MNTQSFLQRTVKQVLAEILIWLMIALTIIPIMDLPIATSVPAPVWLLLAVLDVALIIALVRIKRTARGTMAIMLGFITVAIRPMYFLVGRHDVNAMASLVEDYYNELQAPHKELIWLESGHGASAEDMVDALVNQVLPESPRNI